MATKVSKVTRLINVLLPNSETFAEGCKVYVYDAGDVTIPANTVSGVWTDANKNNAADRPMVLDANGSIEVYAQGDLRFKVFAAADVDDSGTPLYDWDDLDYESNRYLTITATTTPFGVNDNSPEDLVLADTDTLGAAMTVNLPPVANAVRPITIVNTGSTYNVTVDGDGAELINGSTTDTLLPGAIGTYVPTGSAWVQSAVDTDDFLGVQMIGSYSNNLTTAITAIGSDAVTLVIDKTITLDAAATVPSNIHLWILQEGLIELGNFALGINGNFTAPLKKVFDYTGSGVVSFGRGYIQNHYPQWYEDDVATGNSDTTPMQRCLASIHADGGKMLLPPPSVSYKASGLVVKTKVYIEGVVPETKIIPDTDATTIAFDTSAHVVRAGLKNLLIDGSATKATFTSQTGIELIAGAGFWLDTINIEHVRVIDCGNRGIEVTGGTGTPNTQFVQRLRMEDVTVISCTNSGLLFKGFVIETVLHRVDVGNNSVDGADAESNVAMILNGAAQVQRLRWTGGIINATTHTTGNSLYIQGAANIYFGTIDFEDCPTSVRLFHALTKNITFDNCRWGAATAITNIFDIEYAENLVVTNCRDGGPITNAFNFSNGAENKVQDFVEFANDFSASTNRYVWWTAALRIDTGVYKVSNPDMISRIDTQSLAASDNLSVIHDADGGVTRFKDGQIIVLAPNNDGDDVVVLDLTAGSAETGANIRLVGGAAGAFTMDSIRDRIALQYDQKLGEFIEIWRADIL